MTAFLFTSATNVIQGAALTIAAVGGLLGFWTFTHGARWKAIAIVAEENAKVVAEGRAVFKARAERLDGELQETRAEAREQRDLKHALQGELMAERKVRDLVPVLEGLGSMARAHEAGVSELKQSIADQESRALDRHEHIVEVLTELRAALVDSHTS